MTVPLSGQWNDSPLRVQLDGEGQGTEELNLFVRTGHKAFGNLPALRRLLDSQEDILNLVDGLWRLGLVQGHDQLGRESARKGLGVSYISQGITHGFYLRQA